MCLSQVGNTDRVPGSLDQATWRRGCHGGRGANSKPDTTGRLDGGGGEGEEGGVATMPGRVTRVSGAAPLCRGLGSQLVATVEAPVNVTGVR